MKIEHWEQLECVSASIRADGNDEDADTIRSILGQNKPYDHIDAAYIFKQLLAIHVAGHHGHLRDAGDLEEMDAMWSAAVEAAQVIHELIPEEELHRFGVWCYEKLDDDGLAILLWDKKCRNIRLVVENWCRKENIRLRTDPKSEEDPLSIIKDFVEVLEGDATLERLNEVSRRAKDYIEGRAT